MHERILDIPGAVNLLTNVTLDYERVLLPKLTTRYGDAMALDRESVRARAAARERLRARYLA